MLVSRENNAIVSSARAMQALWESNGTLRATGAVYWQRCALGESGRVGAHCA